MCYESLSCVHARMGVPVGSIRTHRCADFIESEDLMPLPSKLGSESGRITVLLFSQPGCEFCAEIRERYLRPLIATAARTVVVAEADIESSATLRDWNGRDVAQRVFATSHGVRFAPTVMVFNAKGVAAAAPIVGLSRDYFGAYLNQRIETALKASQDARGS